MTLHRACDTVTFATTYSSNKNSNNVKVQSGYSGNVYLVGYQLKKPGGRDWSPLINPEDIKFGKDFITSYRAYLHTGNEFIVRPVYRPFEARVMFRNGDIKKAVTPMDFRRTMCALYYVGYHQGEGDRKSGIFCEGI